MTGLRPMLGIHWRTRRRTILVWVLALVGSMLFTAVAVARLYESCAQSAPNGIEAIWNAAMWDVIRDTNATFDAGTGFYRSRRTRT